MAVAERDDRDPAAEVEVLAAVGVPHPAAVAPHEREIGARVRRAAAARALVRRVTWRAHATTAVCADLRADAEARGAYGRHELRDDAAVERVRVEELRRPIGVEERQHRAFEIDPGHIGHEHDPIRLRCPAASAVAASSAFTFSGPTATGVTTGIRPASSASTIAVGAARSRLADDDRAPEAASPRDRSRRRRGGAPQGRVRRTARPRRRPATNARLRASPDRCSDVPRRSEPGCPAPRARS